jgi:uroporphyrinogen-III synthase
LAGKRVLVTRTREQSSELSVALSVAGAIPVEFPVIRIAPPADWNSLDRALEVLSGESAVDWLIFTSTNGVKMMLQRLATLDYPVALLQKARIATIGPATAAALERVGLHADLVPTQFVGEGLVKALHADSEANGKSLVGQRIVFVRAAEGRHVLVDELKQEGAEVLLATAYQTLPVEQDDVRGQEIADLLRRRELDFITFTSSSTVTYFVHWLTRTLPELVRDLATADGASPVLACIGPITAQTVRSYGMEVAVEAHEYTITGLVQALCEFSNKQH